MTTPSSANPADQLRAAAVAFIAAQPGGPQRLLAQHTADATGRCRGCTTPGYGTAHGQWPCTPVLLARAAAQDAS
ncbi:hypothetical protein ACQEVB_32370 [Pseudonocardia sp. CA-107938]|uniref:hypothetical protein n=1 Tax=Pseudonocardia sp. CA-107938 TaxID=3240021 RepID=UPI003D8F4966